MHIGLNCSRLAVVILIGNNSGPVFMHDVYQTLYGIHYVPAIVVYINLSFHTYLLVHYHIKE